ncbi:hypothetical protein [Treponema phagedenis]|uniref:hypothetical protein n=1 Tax=Treponema phagedenis TaxID=162 RepID=UPI000463A783|nr:hypothetical protein [Treponema phagedenis]
MKKMIFVGLIVLLLGGCGKVEKGRITIENKSSYEIEIEFAQNYSSKIIKLQSGDSIDRSWERYFHCIIQKPSINILKKQQTKEKITISDKNDLVSYRIINNLPKSIKVNGETMELNIRLLDEKQYLLSQNSKYVNYIDVDAKKPYNDITLFRPITKDNIFIMCLDKNNDEAKFNFKYKNETSPKTYRVIEKNEDLLFQQISDDGKELVISRIEVKIINVKSGYIDEHGNNQTSIIPTIFINKI